MSLRFDYQIPIWRSFLGGAFCCAFAISMGYFSHLNDKGLRLFRLITFTPSEATVLYWAFTVVLVFAAVLFCILAARSMKGSIVICLEDTYLSAPRAAIKSELLPVPYASIKQVHVSNVKHQEMVTINSSAGQVTLMAMGFRSPQEFAKFKHALAERVNG